MLKSAYYSPEMIIAKSNQNISDPVKKIKIRIELEVNEILNGIKRLQPLLPAIYFFGWQ